MVQLVGLGLLEVTVAVAEEYMGEAWQGETVGVNMGVRVMERRQRLASLAGLANRRSCVEAGRRGANVLTRSRLRNTFYLHRERHQTEVSQRLIRNPHLA